MITGSRIQALRRPLGILSKAMADDKREQLKQIVKSKLPRDKIGVISYMARVNAVRGHA